MVFSTVTKIEQPGWAVQLFQYDDDLNYFIFAQWELTHPHVYWRERD